MFIDINKIPADGIRFDHALRLPQLDGLAGEPIPVRTARLTGEAHRGARGVELRSRLVAGLDLVCGRCLERFPQEIDTEFFLTLVPDTVEEPTGGGEVAEDDVSLFPCAEGKAELADIATEQLYLNLPLKPVCRPGCLGLCPRCGVNRNRTACDCGEDAVDPRLAPLLKFKTRTSGS